MFKKVAARIKPSDLTLNRSNKRVAMKFADAMNMVYFGRVHSGSEDFELIRGLTSSQHQQDKHYMVGSLYDYDIAFIERSATLHFPGKPSRHHVWQVMQFDLHTAVDMPHSYIGLRSHSEVFYAHLFAKFSQLQEAAVNVFGSQEEDFFRRYAIYTSAMHYQFTQYLLDQTVRSTMASHFGSLTAEIYDGSLYVYSEHKRLTKPLLEAMLQNGIWLARHLDERMTTLQTHQPK